MCSTDGQSCVLSCTGEVGQCDMAQGVGKASRCSAA